MPYAIMTDADWCIPSSGTFLQCHTPSRRMPIGASRQVGHWTISGCLRDGCRLVHPIRRFIRYIIQFKMSGIDQFVYNSIYHSHSFGFQISHFNSIFTFVLSFQRYTQSMYLFHILIHVLISYTHSCTLFIYSFMYSFIYSFMYSFHILIS